MGLVWVVHEANAVTPVVPVSTALGKAGRAPLSSDTVGCLNTATLGTMLAVLCIIITC